MTKLSYQFNHTSPTKMTFEISGLAAPEPQKVRFDNQMMPVEEVVSMLLCSGMSEQGVLDWLERRMEVGRFAPKVRA